jgi:molecular chaperone GrpE
VVQEKETEVDMEVAEEQESERVEQAAEQVEEHVEVGESAEAEGEPEGAEGELERLSEELEKVSAQAAEYLDGWQRAQAEFSNYKKRHEVERVQAATLASVALLRRLLTVVDDFERAVATLPIDLSRLTWCEGVFLIKHKLDAILESEGVKPIETEGRAFDPHYHQAVTHEEVSGYEDGQIIGEVQRGYTLGERVLRPALVRVAKAPVASQPEPTAE